VSSVKVGLGTLPAVQGVRVGCAAGIFQPQTLLYVMVIGTPIIVPGCFDEMGNEAVSLL